MNEMVNDNTQNTNNLPDPNALILNDIIADDSTPWKIHNCKIIDKTITQEAPLPFLYHYDALPQEVKSANLLTAELLKHFKTPMTASQAANLLNINKELISVPWQVKVNGTLVMFCERLQLALRLKFSNTAKELDPIYCQTADEALKIAMQDWHFYGNVFVLNKGITHKKPTSLIVVDKQQNWAPIEQTDDYQALRPIYALPILEELVKVKGSLNVFNDAIQLRLL